MLCLRSLRLALAFAGIINAQVNLRTAYSFAVLAGTTITNTGYSLISGNIGVSPGTSITGFPPGTVTNGVIHAADAVALQAQNDLTNAYNAAARLPPNTNLTGQDLGGKTLVAGVYSFSTNAQLTGLVVLDGKGNSSSVWVFQIGSNLTTAAFASVLLVNSGSPCNVFWLVGTSASVAANNTFVGNILALASITTGAESTFNGGLYALHAAVTLAENYVPAGASCPTTTGPICVSAQYKCGYNLVPAQGYNSAQLATAANVTSTIPPLTTNQLLQVLYYCNDTYNHIVGNSFCIAGCITMPLFYDDQCAR
ncbi:hypothetical protein ACHAQJ_001231 [Trichoderma viride]